jgi:hypothetical protein
VSLELVSNPAIKTLMLTIFRLSFELIIYIKNNDIEITNKHTYTKKITSSPVITRLIKYQFET